MAIKNHTLSNEYTQDPHKQWFVLRATYNRQKKAYDYIVSKGEVAYMPLHYTQKIVCGKKKRALEPYLPQLLFVYASTEKICELVEHTPELSFLSYYYNHFKTDKNGKNPPLTISYTSMMNFIRITSIDNEHIKVVAPELCHYKNGDLVRVTEGDFTGVEGRVARVSGQQRVVVEIEGLCIVTTAYIPSAFIEKITS